MHKMTQESTEITLEIKKLPQNAQNDARKHRNYPRNQETYPECKEQPKEAEKSP